MSYNSKDASQACIEVEPDLDKATLEREAGKTSDVKNMQTLLSQLIGSDYSDKLKLDRADNRTIVVLYHELVLSRCKELSIPGDVCWRTGAALRDRRVEKDLSLTELAIKAEVAVDSIKHHEAGQSCSSIVEQISLCEALDWTLSDLYRRAAKIAESDEYPKEDSDFLSQFFCEASTTQRSLR